MAKKLLAAAIATGITGITAAMLLPSAANAAGYAVPNTNSRDEGMGGSAIANQNGAEAAYANGAALAGKEGLMVSASGSLVWFNSSWTSPTGQGNASTNASPATPPNFAASYGLRLGGVPVAVGFALAVPGGGQVQWPADWAGRSYVTLVDRRVFSYDLALAVQLHQQLKLSVGGAYFYATEHLKQALAFASAPGCTGLGCTQDGQAELGTSGGAPSWTAALEATPIKDLPLRIGLQYKHKADLKLTGHAHFTGVPASLQTQGLIDQAATHRLTFPNVFNAGLAYDVSRDLTLQAALTFFRFVVYKADDFVGDKNLTIHVPFDYTNSMTYRLGLEYGGLVPGLKLRLGAVRDLSPQRSSTVSPSLPDSSRWAFNFGAGYDLTPSLTVNAAVELARFDALAVQPSGDTLQGSYSTSATVASVGVAYQMK
jgi:long-chain fatty acid transport protein